MAICETKELFKLGSTRFMWAGQEVRPECPFVTERKRLFGLEQWEVTAGRGDEVRFCYQNPGILLANLKKVGEDVNRDPFLQGVVRFVPSKRPWRRVFVVRAAEFPLAF